MTNKAKKILMITGLIVCFVITILTNVSVDKNQNNSTGKINTPAGLTQVIVNTGTTWIIQTTYKLLKPIQ